ncbi:hypothetical protein ABZ369_22440 [Streptomyces sp. NPDC005918]
MPRLPKDFPTRDPGRVPDCERHATDYQGSRGGWLKSAKPTTNSKEKTR